MYNKWIAIGNLTRDPKLGSTGSNEVCNFTIACNHRYKGQDDVLFMDCTVFGKQAETLCEYTKKGSQIVVEGRITQREWEKDGQKHRKIECLVQNIRFVGKKSERSDERGDEEDESF